ncbi:MAG: Ig-like domain-containing protein, partial [Solirubrobacterales bacterium]
LRKQGAGSDVPANVSYAGNTATIDPNADLDPSAVYNVTVAGTVTDANGNQLGADDTWSFTTASLSFIDTTVSDFGAGTPGADTYVSETDNGEVTLKPTEGSEFSGSSLPTGWQSCPWSDPENCTPGTGATDSGGSLHVDGSYARTIATYGSGRSLEFRATFNQQNNQHAGFGVDMNNSPNWAIFSVKFDGTFNARTNNGGASTETQLPIGLVGTSHLYRIEWDTNEVRYYVDGALVATHAANFGATQMRPIASDLTAGGPELTVDWMRMSPYPGSGTFDSRVFDAGVGQTADWGALSWNSVTPSVTGIAISVRTGDTPTPDGTWSAFAAISSSGGDIPGSSRYVQYRAALTSSDPAQTPTLSEVSIGYTTVADNTAPTITGRSPTPNATDVPRNTNVQVQFSEPMNPGTIDSSSVHLQKQGTGTDVPATVSYAGTTATLDPNADLDPSAVYTVTVDGSVEDQAGNALGAPDSWSFTTATPSFNFTDTTVSDFGAGTPGANTYVSETANGEVILKPTEGQEFSAGPGLPAGWSSSTWESSGGGAGGTATVSAGSLHVDGAIAGTDATFSPGHALEFVATFGATAFQHAGFGVDVNTSPNWAMFSTNNTADQLFARTNVGGTAVNTPIGSSNQYVGSPHLYRIEWDTTEIRYYVDGALVTTQAADFGTTQMRPLASDFNSGGPNLSVNWLHLSPYPSSGTFDSRVFDAGPGQNVAWGALSWNSATPSGTGIAISVRTGDTPTPDGTWSAFAPIASSGGDIPGSSRFVQYRAELSTTDPKLTPTLNDVTVNGVGDIPPTAVNDTKTVAEDSGATAIDVLANDTNPDGGPKTIASVTQPAHGTVAITGGGSGLTYQPNPNYCNDGSPTDDFT